MVSGEKEGEGVEELAVYIGGVICFVCGADGGCGVLIGLIMGTRYYFFRDIDCDGNGYGDMTYHAAGVVDRVSNEREDSDGNKDLSVSFFHPFDGMVIRAWRAWGEVRVYEVDQCEWEYLVNVYKKIEISLQD